MLMLVLHNVLAADKTMKHYHRGKLPKYELSSPSIMLSSGDEEVLRDGRALMQVIVQPDGKRRLLMVRDVATPAWVVMDRILDFPAYPRMVKGCDAMVPYHDKREARPRQRNTRRRGARTAAHALRRMHCGSRTTAHSLPLTGAAHTALPPPSSSATGVCRQGRLRVMKAAYEIHAGPCYFKYFMHHEVDEKQKCMTFHLDYDRCAAPELQPAPEPNPRPQPWPSHPSPPLSTAAARVTWTTR